jgi:hypothetical protein
MPLRVQEVLREALALPIAERADVAAELLASLDDATSSEVYVGLRIKDRSREGAKFAKKHLCGLSLNSEVGA